MADQVTFVLKKSVDNFSGGSVAGFDGRFVDVGKLLEEGGGAIVIDQQAATVNGTELEELDNGAALIAALDSVDALKRASGKALEEAVADTPESAGGAGEQDQQDAPDTSATPSPQANVGPGSGASTKNRR